MQLSESDLSFEFNADWVIRKYDLHPYFITLASVGFKGVDFIGIYQCRRAVLFEVKNYRLRSPDIAPDRIVATLSAPALLAEKIAQKAADTLHAINIVHKYYQRKWLYRLVLPLLKVLPNRYFTVNTWLFWTRLHKMIEEGNWEFVFWLEADPSYEGMPAEEVAAFHEKIAALLPVYFKDLTQEVQISNMSTHIDADSVRVRVG